MVSASEQVDLVDDDDRVIGRADRSEMRTRNLLHRAVYILVVNSKSQLFVHQRTATKDIYPSHWDVTVGGVVTAGESYADAATRELHEELGIAGATARLLGPLRYADTATQLLGAVFLATHDGAVTMQGDEISRGAFVSIASAEVVLAEERCCPDGALAFRTYFPMLSTRS